MSIKRYPLGGGSTAGSTIAGASDFDSTNAAVGQLVAVSDVSGGEPSGFGLVSDFAARREALRGDERVKAMAMSPPYAPPVMESPPTVGQAITVTTGLTRSVSVSSGIYRWDAPSTDGSTPRYYTFADGTGVAASTPAAEVKFDIDAPQFDFVLFGRTGMQFRIWVNEEAVSTGFTTIGFTSATVYVNVTFGARSDAPRRIVIEVFCSSGPIQFFGVRCTAADTVWPTSLASPKVAIVGDSFGIGGGADLMHYGYARTLGRLMGWADTRSNFSSVGSTGIAQGSSVTVGNYGSRLAGDIIPWQPDLVIIQGSQNDRPHVDSGLIGPALSSYVSTLKAAVPRVTVIVVGVLYVATPTAADVKINNEMRAAAVADGLDFIDLFSPYQFFTGTGNVGTPTLDGNADRYRIADNSHPSNVGHWAAAQLLAGRLTRVLNNPTAAAATTA